MNERMYGRTVDWIRVCVCARAPAREIHTRRHIPFVYVKDSFKFVAGTIICLSMYCLLHFRTINVPIFFKKDKPCF
jgi:hypothetical protein